MTSSTEQQAADTRPDDGRPAAPVVIYGADWCGDCRRSKRLLDRLGVAYEWVDLVARPEQTEEVLRRNGGARSIPVVVFADGSHLTEPTDPELSARLSELGLVR